MKRYQVPAFGHWNWSFDDDAFPISDYLESHFFAGDHKGGFFKVLPPYRAKVGSLILVLDFILLSPWFDCPTVWRLSKEGWRWSVWKPRPGRRPRLLMRTSMRYLQSYFTKCQRRQWSPIHWFWSFYCSSSNFSFFSLKKILPFDFFAEEGVVELLCRLSLPWLHSLVWITAREEGNGFSSSFFFFFFLV